MTLKLYWNDRSVDIFRLTSRPDINYFYRNQDSHDLRLGSLVKSNPLNYEESMFVLLGCPQDEGVTRNNGEPGTAQAPTAIRRALYQLGYPKELEEAGFFDLGNVILEGTLEESHEKLYQIVKHLLEDGKTVLVLGGGSDISYPDVSALSDLGDTVVVNVNNKYNIMESDQRHNENSYHLLMKDGKLKADRLIHLGIQPAANSYGYHQYLKERGSKIYYQRHMKLHGLKTIFSELRSQTNEQLVFWGFDMNVVSSSDAPGVKTLTPTGISADEAVEIARFAGGLKNSKILEITEINPSIDVDHRTSRLAAMMIVHFISKRVL